MCLRQGYPPVFLKTPGWPSPFLDDLIGKSLADDLRSAFGFAITPRNPFGVFCGGDDSYLTSAFSSMWALAAVSIAFGAGLLLVAKRRIACWLFAICVVLPAIDTGVRVYAALQRGAGHPGAAEFQTVLMHNLPAQMLTNVVFQMVLPLIAGLTLERFVSAAESMLAVGWSRLFSRSR